MSGVIINGERQSLDPGTTVRDVLRANGIDADNARGIAVALNDEVVHREKWTSTSLDEGDRVEIITARQGG